LPPRLVSWALSPRLMLIFTRRQIETSVAAMLAAVTAIVGIAGRDELEPVGPKYLALEKVGRFRQPVQVVQPPRSDALFVVEKAGRIRVVEGGEIRARPFLDIHRRVEDRGEGGEQGLLSVAFAPDYPESGRFYVAYTDRRDDLRVVEYRRSSAADHLANRFSAREVITIPQPTTKHHGGMLLFGPGGHLYVGSGDGGPSGDPDGSAQNPASLLGKILRIDPEPAGGRPYSIPRDNPFVGRPGRDEVYAYGLRNPWRFSFDRATGALAIGDVGNDRFEEIDYVPAGKGRGANFGWAAYEGFARFRGGVPKGKTVLPVLAYPHGPGCAVTGGYVVRDPSLTRLAGREIVGRYVFGDFCSGRIFSFRPRPRKAIQERRLRFKIPSLTSFGEDSQGRIYIVSQRGPVWRLVPRRKGG
jgi:glucose/arabinose dehydrogenase